MTIIEALKAEIAMRESEYNFLIEQAVRLLQDGKDSKPSTHLGHNLASRASDLSVVAGKIEATRALLRHVEAQGTN